MFQAKFPLKFDRVETMSHWHVNFTLSRRTVGEDIVFESAGLSLLQESRI